MAAHPRIKVLLYGDEADIHLNPHLTRGWYLRGAPRRVPAAGTNQKRAVFGALNAQTGRLLVQTAPQKSGALFVLFLQSLLRAHPGKHVYLVLDHGPIHEAHIVAEFLRKHRRRLTILWLPKYSPNFNLIERVWGYLKRSALANIFYGTVGRLIVALARAVRAFNDARNLVLKLLFARHPPSPCQRRAA